VIQIKKIVRFLENKVEELADWSAHTAGSPWFLMVHAVWFAAWIIFQVEPFPYGLLTMIVSLEAILLSGLILSATDRESERDRTIMKRDLKVSKETQELLIHMHEELAEIKQYVRENKKAAGKK
jgi:uncharacterized membrane protein